MTQIDKFSFKNVSGYFRKDYRIILLSLLIACNSIPAYALFYMPGIDGPLPWVFNYLADGHFEKASCLLFPHGPMAFLMYPLPMGNNLYATIIVTCISSFLLALNLFRLAPRMDLLLSFICIFILQTFFEIQHLFFAVSLSFVLLYHQRNGVQHLVAAVFFALLNLYVKSYGGVISLLMIMALSVYLCFRGKYRHMAYVIISIALLHLFAWLLLFGTFSGAFTFLRGQVELSAGNADAVSYFQVNNWPLITVSLATLLLIPFVTRDRNTRFLFLMLLLPLFGAWKHAMSRGDGAHVNGFLSILVLTAFFLLFYAQENRMRVLLLSGISVIAFITNMGVTASYNDFEEEKRVAAIRTFNLYKYIVHHDSVKRFRERENAAMNRTAILPDSLRRLIGKRSVDIFPWNYSIVSENSLNWIPRPTLHTYAMYSEWLDQKNAEHLSSPGAAELILWEIKELGGGLVSIDNRYLLNDGPQVTETLLSRYALVYKDDRYFLYERRAEAHVLQEQLLGEQRNYRFQEWITVPQVVPTAILKAKIDIRNNFKGTLKSVLFKGEGFHVSMELEDGRVVDHKIIPSTSRQGIWLNPLIKFPGTAEPEPAVRRIRVFCTDTSNVREYFSVQFSKAEFTDGHDYLRTFFGKAEARDTLSAAP